MNKKRAITPKKKWTQGGEHPQYPEMFFDAAKPPNAEYKARLMLQAKDSGIIDGYYQAWEIARYLNAIAAQRDTAWLRTIQEHNAHMLTMMELQARLIEIHSYVARTPGKLYYEIEEYGVMRRVYPFTDADAGRIGDELIRFTMEAERIGLPAAEAPIIGIAQETIIGLRYLLNGIDNGEHLRQHVTAIADQLFFNIGQYVENFPLPGRNRGSLTAATRILGERGLQLTHDQKMTISEAVLTLKAELKEFSPTTPEGEAYAELAKRTGKKAADYLREAIRRWRRSQEGETNSG